MVMGPVGPPTDHADPLKGPAIRPAATADHMPAIAPSPEATPKAKAMGSTTIATVIPASTSPRTLLAIPLKLSLKLKSLRYRRIPAVRCSISNFLRPTVQLVTV